MRTIKLELSVKILLGAIALGLFLNAFKDFPPKAHANTIQQVEVVNTVDVDGKIEICGKDIVNSILTRCVRVSHKGKLAVLDTPF